MSRPDRALAPDAPRLGAYLAGVPGATRSFVVSGTRPAPGFGHADAEAPRPLDTARVRARAHWRWWLRERTHRLPRTHGDFHPWNILFREGTGFSVLDRSRGEWGDVAEPFLELSLDFVATFGRATTRFDPAGVPWLCGATA